MLTFSRKYFEIFRIRIIVSDLKISFATQVDPYSVFNEKIMNAITCTYIVTCYAHYLYDRLIIKNPSYIHKKEKRKIKSLNSPGSAKVMISEVLA